jgi:hypothetical protein
LQDEATSEDVVEKVIEIVNMMTEAFAEWKLKLEEAIGRAEKAEGEIEKMEEDQQESELKKYLDDAQKLGKVTAKERKLYEEDYKKSKDKKTELSRMKRYIDIRDGDDGEDEKLLSGNPSSGNEKLPGEIIELMKKHKRDFTKKEEVKKFVELNSFLVKDYPQLKRYIGG